MLSVYPSRNRGCCPGIVLGNLVVHVFQPRFCLNCPFGSSAMSGRGAPSLYQKSRGNLGNPEDHAPPGVRTQVHAGFPHGSQHPSCEWMTSCLSSFTRGMNSLLLRQPHSETAAALEPVYGQPQALFVPRGFGGRLGTAGDVASQPAVGAGVEGQGAVFQRQLYGHAAQLGRDLGGDGHFQGVGAGYLR